SAGTTSGCCHASCRTLDWLRATPFHSVITVSLAFVAPARTWRLPPAFSATLTTSAIGPKQLAVVWTLILQSEPEGPALISCAARLHRVGCHSYMVASSLRRRGAPLSANRWAYSLRPIDANHSAMPFMARPVDGVPHAAGPARPSPP